MHHGSQSEGSPSYSTSFNVKNVSAKEHKRDFVASNSKSKTGKEISTFMTYVICILVLFLSFGNIRSIDYLPAGFTREDITVRYPRVRVR